ncbi:polysaccharide biosynthesis tyrosine autokinase [Candidatus Poribacteria bacterium]|nr:polysaccharide biosynthesis tyrosine autokinase [Candidatus Poribacteria bacterium]
MNNRITVAGVNKPESFYNPIVLSALLRALWKRRWAVASVFLVTVTVTAIKSFGAPRVYRATTQVLIDRENPNVVDVQEVLAVDTADTDYYLTQYEILKSRSLARRAVESLDLASNDVFNPQPKRTVLAGLTGSRASGEGPNPSGHAPERKPESEERKLQILIDRYLRSLNIEPVRNSRLVNISFESTDPRLAARIADEHARLYIETTLDRKFSASQDAVGWIRGRIATVQAKLEESEQTLQKYREEKNLVSVDLEERHNIIVQKLSDLNTALTNARTETIEKESHYREFAKARSNPKLLESLPAVVNNSLIQKLKSERVGLDARRSEWAQKFGPAHPQMISLESELEQLDKKIDAEIYKIGESIEMEHRMAVANERSLMAALEAQKHEALDLNQKEIYYNVLKREAESERLMYENLLKRAKETSLTEGLRASNIAIVDPSYIPNKPVRPRRALNMFVAVVAGLVLGVGLALVLDQMDSTIKNSEDVEQYVDLPFLGMVRHFKRSDNGKEDGELVTAFHPKSAISEAFRNIRTNILFSTLGTGGRTLLVTSSGTQEGKTLFACNLAVTLAQLQKKVLLIDSDLRRPRIHKVFGIKDSPGLSNILAGQLPLEKCARPTAGGNLSLLPCGPIPPNPSELLSSKAMEDLIAEARQNYDVVIFDSPPVLLVTDPAIVSNKVDGTIVLASVGRTQRHSLRRTVSALGEISARVIGIVLNNADSEAESYSYGYAKYGYYYDDNGEKERRTSKEHLKPAEEPSVKA